MPKRKRNHRQHRRAGRRIKCWTAWVKSKDTYVVRWIDPADGTTHQETANTTRQRVAERQLADKERQLRQLAEGGIPWALVKDRYQAEVLAHQKRSGHGKWRSANNKLDDLLAPRLLVDIDASMMSQFGAELRSLDLATDTIKGYMIEISRTLNWAAEIWENYEPPAIRPPKTVKRKRMKGRPITREEFDRMLQKVPAIVGEQYGASWRRYLIGLWLSGLRLGESLKLSWDDLSTLRVYDLQPKRPKLATCGEQEKGNQDRIFPMTPDFGNFLRRTSPAKRKGRVFRPELSRGRVGYHTASATITAIGEAAGVVVNVAQDGKRKFASAHDLRRAFGTRWAPRMKPAVLQKYMRHESIQSVMSYYVDLDIDDAADEVYRTHRAHNRDLKRDRPRRGEHKENSQS